MISYIVISVIGLLLVVLDQAVKAVICTVFPGGESTVNNEIVVCKARGKFRKMGITPLVGDNVVIDKENNYIMEILKRKNVF